MSYLESANTRKTRQQESILSYLQSHHIHASAQEIFQEVKKNLPTISRATVYRNLKRLIESGKVREVQVQGVQTFEAKKEDHGHFLCRKCKKVEDLEESSRYLKTLKKQYPTHTIESAEFTLVGLCNSCKNSKDGGRKQ